MPIEKLTREELVQHALALRTVLRVAEAVHRSSDFADLAERAVDAIVQYTRHPAVALFRIDAARERAELVSYRGFSRKIVEVGRSLPLDGSLTGVAVQRRNVVTTDDIGSDERVEPNTRKALDAEGFSDVACVPLFFREDVIGCLNLIYKSSPRLTEHERSILLTIGRTIALAMQNRVDAEERRQLHGRLLRTQQLESLGVLAGGIAHDFNNLLAGIVGSISVAKNLLAAPERLTVLLDIAEKAALRAADLARQLLALSRGGAPLERRTSDVASVVREAAEFAARGSGVACDVESVGEIGLMLVDSAQLARVVQNLVLNATQASPSGGRVSVRLERRIHASGPVLRLSVGDQGAGIAPELIGRIFDPYFTTRSAGSGLGLAITHAIVERHGGHIDVDSVPGKGTTFQVELPVVAVAAEKQDVRPRALPEGVRVLLVDDDENVRQTGLAMLCYLGLDAVVASNSDEAVAMFERAEREGAPFRGVILDLTMVGSQDGVATLARLRAIDPGVRALVSSGYSEGAEYRDFEAHGFAGSLPKPYTLEALSAALTELLA
jgi:signal transduction histidine kinase/CheY-like chemotaxis protein